MILFWWDVRTIKSLFGSYINFFFIYIFDIIYGIHIFLFIDWLKVCHVIKNRLTILQKLGQNRK